MQTLGWLLLAIISAPFIAAAVFAVAAWTGFRLSTVWNWIRATVIIRVLLFRLGRRSPHIAAELRRELEKISTN